MLTTHNLITHLFNLLPVSGMCKDMPDWVIVNYPKDDTTVVVNVGKSTNPLGSIELYMGESHIWNERFRINHSDRELIALLGARLRVDVLPTEITVRPYDALGNKKLVYLRTTADDNPWVLVPNTLPGDMTDVRDALIDEFSELTGASMFSPGDLCKYTKATERLCTTDIIDRVQSDDSQGLVNTVLFNLGKEITGRSYLHTNTSWRLTYGDLFKLFIEEGHVTVTKSNYDFKPHKVMDVFYLYEGKWKRAPTGYLYVGMLGRYILDN